MFFLTKSYLAEHAQACTTLRTSCRMGRSMLARYLITDLSVGDGIQPGMHRGGWGILCAKRRGTWNLVQVGSHILLVWIQLNWKAAHKHDLHVLDAILHQAHDGHDKLGHCTHRLSVACRQKV